MRYSGAAILVVLVLSLAACGGADDSATPTESASTPTSNAQEDTTVVSPDEPAPDDAESGSASAQIVLGGTTYEFPEGSCTVTIAGDTVADFTNGDDDLNFISVNHSVSIVAILEGQHWLETRDAVEADANDPGNVTWSGGLLKQSTEEPLVDTTITLHC